MNITLTWNDFKSFNTVQGTQILYIKDVNNDVTKCTVINDFNRANLVFVFTNPPSKSNFTGLFPGALQVNDIV